MSNLLAKTALTLVTASGAILPSQSQRAPSLPQTNTTYLSEIRATQQRIHDLQQQMQQLNSQLNQIQTLPLSLPQLSVPAPSIIKLPSFGNIQPYGPSFQFNGLKVYVEPIATASIATRQFTITPNRVGEVLHPLANEPIGLAPARTATAPATHP